MFTGPPMPPERSPERAAQRREINDGHGPLRLAAANGQPIVAEGMMAARARNPRNGDHGPLSDAQALRMTLAFLRSVIRRLPRRSALRRRLAHVVVELEYEETEDDLHG